MARVRALIVDDSVVVRKVLTDTLAADPSIEVVGTAPNGVIALKKIPQVNPDLIVLDVEMPEMDGLETVKRIRLGWPKLPVIMCSSLTERGAETTLRALAFGASDYVAKPSRLNANELTNLNGFKAELVAKVKALCGVDITVTAAQAPVRAPTSLAAPRTRTWREPVSVLAIGCSTGGPTALATVFAGLPRDLPVPILIVQHMPPLFTKLLAERLAASSGIKVTEAAHGDRVEPGCAYVAPGDYHMTVVSEGVHRRIALNQDAPECSCRPAVDVMFRSAAKVYGGGVLAAVLTGMGHDGTRGARAIADAGGTIIVQSALTCVVPSMPQGVVDAGLASGVFPLDQLAQELVAGVRRSTFTPFASIAPRSTGT